MKKVFISHSHKDLEIVKQFIDKILVDGLSIPRDIIFCTSAKGTGIMTGKDWRNYIKDNITSSELPLMIITPNYKESEMCQNELGAMWQLEIDPLPLIVDPIDFKDCGVLNVIKQGEKLLDSDTIDKIRDIVEEKKLNGSKIKSENFNDKKNEFISVVKSYVKNNPFPDTLNREIFESKIKTIKEQESTIASLSKQKSKLELELESVKKLKDQDEVKIIEDKYSDESEFCKFNELCTKLSNLLSRQNYYIKSLIYSDLTQKPIGDPDKDDFADIRQAVGEGKITEDCSIIWEESEMKNICEAFYELKNFLDDENRTEKFFKKFAEENHFDCDINNSKFWDDILGVKIRF